jgi:hypothetical protein
MTLWPDEAKYRLADQAGLSLEAAQWLAGSVTQPRQERDGDPLATCAWRA